MLLEKLGFTNLTMYRLCLVWSQLKKLKQYRSNCMRSSHGEIHSYKEFKFKEWKKYFNIKNKKIFFFALPAFSLVTSALNKMNNQFLFVRAFADLSVSLELLLASY